MAGLERQVKLLFGLDVDPKNTDSLVRIQNDWKRIEQAVEKVQERIDDVFSNREAKAHGMAPEKTFKAFEKFGLDDPKVLDNFTRKLFQLRKIIDSELFKPLQVAARQIYSPDPTEALSAARKIRSQLFRHANTVGINLTPIKGLSADAKKRFLSDVERVLSTVEVRPRVSPLIPSTMKFNRLELPAPGTSPNEELYALKEIFSRNFRPKPIGLPSPHDLWKRDMENFRPNYTMPERTKRIETESVQRLRAMSDAATFVNRTLGRIYEKQLSRPVLESPEVMTERHRRESIPGFFRILSKLDTLFTATNNLLTRLASLPIISKVVPNTFSGINLPNYARMANVSLPLQNVYQRVVSRVNAVQQSVAGNPITQTVTQTIPTVVSQFGQSVRRYLGNTLPSGGAMRNFASNFSSIFRTVLSGSSSPIKQAIGAAMPPIKPPPTMSPGLGAVPLPPGGAILGQVGGLITGHIVSSLVTGLGKYFSFISQSFHKTIGFIRGLFDNMLVKLTAILGAISAVGQGIEALRQGNDELVGRFRTKFIIDTDTKEAGRQPDFERLLDKVVDKSVFPRGEIRDAFNEAMLLGLNLNEVKTVGPLALDIASARGRDIRSVMNALVYFFRFGLQDEFRRLTGFVSQIGEEPEERNRRALQHLQKTFGRGEGQSSLLARTDLFAKLRQQFSMLLRDVGFAVVAGVLQQPLTKLRDNISLLTNIRNVDAVDVLSKQPKQPSTFEFMRGIQKGQISFLEAAAKAVSSSLETVFAGRRSFSEASEQGGIKAAIGEGFNRVKDIMLAVFPTILDLIFRFEITKWGVVIQLIANILPAVLAQSLKEFPKLLFEGAKFGFKQIASVFDRAQQAVNNFIIRGERESVKLLMEKTDDPEKLKELQSRLFAMDAMQAMNNLKRPLNEKFSEKSARDFSDSLTESADKISDSASVGLKNFSAKVDADDLINTPFGEGLSNLFPTLNENLSNYGIALDGVAETLKFIAQLDEEILAQAKLKQLELDEPIVGSRSVSPSYDMLTTPFGDAATRGDIGSGESNPYSPFAKNAMRNTGFATGASRYKVEFPVGDGANVSPSVAPPVSVPKTNIQEAFDQSKLISRVQNEESEYRKQVGRNLNFDEVKYFADKREAAIYSYSEQEFFNKTRRLKTPDIGAAIKSNLDSFRASVSKPQPIIVPSVKEKTENEIVEYSRNVGRPINNLERELFKAKERAELLNKTKSEKAQPKLTSNVRSRNTNIPAVMFSASDAFSGNTRSPGSLVKATFVGGFPGSGQVGVL